MLQESKLNLDYEKRYKEKNGKGAVVTRLRNKNISTISIYKATLHNSFLNNTCKSNKMVNAV